MRAVVPEGVVGSLSETIGVLSLLVVALVPGAVMAAGAITVAASAYCAFGSFCLYSGANFDGHRVQYDGDALFCQDGAPALNVHNVLPTGVRSVVNNTEGTSAGIGITLWAEPRHLVLTSIRPGSEWRGVDGAGAGGDSGTAQSLCAYPAHPAR